MESKLDKWDVDKLNPVPVDLKIWSDVVDKKIVKEDVYDELVKKFNAIDTSTTSIKQIIMIRSGV